jgi:hypothetical protein
MQILNAMVLSLAASSHLSSHLFSSYLCLVSFYFMLKNNTSENKLVSSCLIYRSKTLPSPVVASDKNGILEDGLTGALDNPV